MRPCTLCNAQTSTPFNFLLSCVRCRSFFHHRCHKPPVSDKELIHIIKQYNLQKQAGNRNPSFIWTCASCAAAQHPILINDDSPPPQPQKSRKTASKPNTLPPPPPPNHRPASPSPTVPNVHTTPYSGIRIIDDPFIDPPPLSSHSSSSSAVLSAELGGLHMSQPPHEEENECDLEYLTPPARPPVPLPPAGPSAQSVRIAQSLPPIAAIVSHHDDHHQEQDDDDEEELEMDEIDPTPPPTLARPVLLPVWIKQHFNPPPASSAPKKPFSRNKSKSQNLAAFTTASRHHPPPHLAPFFLFADQWLQDKKRTLPEYPSGVH